MNRELNQKVRVILHGPFPSDRCGVFGWPLAPAIQDGCTADSCSMRPVPARRADEPADYSGDNGLALAALMEFADKHGLVWRLHYEGDHFECWFSKLDPKGMPTQLHRSQQDATPARAICEAIIKAAEAVKA